MPNMKKKLTQNTVENKAGATCCKSCNCGADWFKLMLRVRGGGDSYTPCWWARSVKWQAMTGTLRW